MHQEKAIQMKEELLRDHINAISEIQYYGFQQKKLMAEGIYSQVIEKIRGAAKKAGRRGGMISSACGFYCHGTTWYKVLEVLKTYSGYCKAFQFTKSRHFSQAI